MTKNRATPASGTGPTFVRIAEDDHDGPAVTVDGRPVPVPAEGDPVTLALGAVAEQARRDGSGVRVVLVDDRDGWEHRLVVRPDGGVDDDPPGPDRGPPRRRWRRFLPAAAGVVLAGVLLAGGAWTATRSRPAPGPGPAGVTALGAVPLPAPSPPPATATELVPPPPPPRASVRSTAAASTAGSRPTSAAGSTGARSTSSRATPRPQPSRPARPTSRRAAPPDRLAATPTPSPSPRSSDAGSSRRGQSDFGAPAVTTTPSDPGSAGRPQSGG